MFTKFLPVVAEFSHAERRTDGRTDGRTDRPKETTKVKVAFFNFANAPERPKSGKITCQNENFQVNYIKTLFILVYNFSYNITFLSLDVDLFL